LSKDEKFLIPGHKFGTSISLFYTWIYQLDKAGITYLPTFNWVETAQALVTMHNNSLKPEHTTLKRYIKHKVFPEPWNHHVETLMGIRDENHKSIVGEEGAKALIEEFESVWNIMVQEPEDLIVVPGIGKITARKLLEAIGRIV
jgi:DNA integrity scanning protein DisA with diadenylate cyclase activity